jgi:hypothetical protein
VSPVRYELGSYIPETAFVIVTAMKPSDLSAAPWHMKSVSWSSNADDFERRGEGVCHETAFITLCLRDSGNRLPRF